MNQNEDVMDKWTLIAMFIAILVIMFSLLSLISACSYSINMVHTQGQAEDVLDDADSVDPTISPTISVPASVF